MANDLEDITENIDMLLQALDNENNPSDKEGNQKGDKEGNQKGDKEGNQKGDKEGNQKGDKRGNQKGDKKGSQKGDEEGSQKGDKEGSQNGNEEGSQNGNEEGSQNGNKHGHGNKSGQNNKPTSLNDVNLENISEEDLEKILSSDPIYQENPSVETKAELEKTERLTEMINNSKQAEEKINQLIEQKNKQKKSSVVDSTGFEIKLIPEVLAIIAKAFKTVKHIGNAPEQTGRINITRYIQAGMYDKRIAQSNIPVFHNKRQVALKDGKFVILVDISGSMITEFGNSATILDKRGHELAKNTETIIDIKKAKKLNKQIKNAGKADKYPIEKYKRSEIALSMAIALEREIKKAGAISVGYTFEEHLHKGLLTNKGGGGSDGLINDADELAPYAQKGYTFIFITDGEFDIAEDSVFYKMLNEIKKRGGGLLLYFTNEATISITTALNNIKSKSAWEKTYISPVFDTTSLKNAFNNLTKLLLDHYI